MTNSDWSLENRLKWIENIALQEYSYGAAYMANMRKILRLASMPDWWLEQEKDNLLPEK